MMDSRAPDNPRYRGRVRAALRRSFVDGLFTNISIALVDSFIVPSILALGAGNLIVAALSGTATLMTGIAHLFSPRLSALAPSRRAVVLRCARFQAMACMFLAGSGWFGWFSIPMAILSYGVFCVAGSMAFSPWASWMGDLVPKAARSRYFALRSSLYGPASGLAIFGTGYIFRAIWGESASAPWAAFGVVFALAAALRFAASVFLGFQHEPPALSEKTPAEDFTYIQFIRKTGESNFARFVVIFGLLHGAASLTGPFFATYVIRDLHFDYLRYTLFHICAIVSSMVFIRFWARVADRWGNMMVLRIASFILALIPIMYLGEGRPWILYSGWIVGGAVWAGLNLASFNLVTETATPRRRVRCYAYMSATIGIMVAAHLFVWGYAVDYLPHLFKHQIQTVFLISAVLRMAASLGFIFLVKERAARPPASALAILYELPAVRPAAEVMRSLLRSFSRD